MDAIKIRTIEKKDNEFIASIIREVLVEMGVNPDQFTVVPKADTQPLVTGYELSNEDLAKNRRVEIIAQVDHESLSESTSLNISPGVFN